MAPAPVRLASYGRLGELRALVCVTVSTQARGRLSSSRVDVWTLGEAAGGKPALEPWATCDLERCSSPGGEDGYDCRPGWATGRSCLQLGSREARTSGWTGVGRWGTCYEYMCCDDGDVGDAGDEHARARPGGAPAHSALEQRAP